MLTRHFLQQSAKQLGVEPKRITDAALQQLSTFSFPGNVRQLENICHWLSVMAPAQMIEAKDLPPEVLASVPEAPRAVSVPPEAALAQTPAGDARPTEHAALVGLPVAHPAAVVWPTTTAASGHWEADLEVEALALLASGQTDVWDVLTRRFESKLIQTALVNTRGRRIEAAQKLGIGRNTITRKIQELGLE